MSEVSSRFAAAIDAFDEAKAADPNIVEAEGRQWPNELLYARQMTEWMDRFAPDSCLAAPAARRRTGGINA